MRAFDLYSEIHVNDLEYNPERPLRTLHYSVSNEDQHTKYKWR